MTTRLADYQDVQRTNALLASLAPVRAAAIERDSAQRATAEAHVAARLATILRRYAA